MQQEHHQRLRGGTASAGWSSVHQRVLPENLGGEFYPLMTLILFGVFLWLHTKLQDQLKPSGTMIPQRADVEIQQQRIDSEKLF